MELILIVVAVLVGRAILKSMAPTHYIHRSKLPLTIEEYNHYVRVGEDVRGFEPAVRWLFFYIKTK